MVTVNLRALVVAVVFALLGGAVTVVINQLISFIFMDVRQPTWTYVFLLLIPGGLVGGALLGWWLVAG